jgi:hypothetical protein
MKAVGSSVMVPMYHIHGYTSHKTVTFINTIIVFDTVHCMGISTHIPEPKSVSIIGYNGSYAHP